MALFRFSCICFLCVSIYFPHLKAFHVVSKYEGLYGLCQNGNHVMGKWVYDNSMTDANKSFFCCSWDNDDVFRFPEICGSKKAKEESVRYAPEKGMAQAGGHACECEIKDGRSKISVREKFKWVPSLCFLSEWNASQFCELLGERVVLLRGDSTSQQTAATLINMIVHGGGRCQKQIVQITGNKLGVSVAGHHSLLSSVR